MGGEQSEERMKVEKQRQKNKGCLPLLHLQAAPPAPRAGEFSKRQAKIITTGFGMADVTFRFMRIDCFLAVYDTHWLITTGLSLVCVQDTVSHRLPECRRQNKHHVTDIHEINARFKKNNLKERRNEIPTENPTEIPIEIPDEIPNEIP